MKTYYIIDGVRYEESGWLGSQIKSCEKGKKVGDTRVILDYMFYVYMITESPWSFLGAKPEVHWGLYIEGGWDYDKKTALLEKFRKTLRG